MRMSTSHTHQVDRETGVPKEREVDRRRKVCEWEGWVSQCVSKDIGSSSMHTNVSEPSDLKWGVVVKWSWIPPLHEKIITTFVVTIRIHAGCFTVPVTLPNKGVVPVRTPPLFCRVFWFFERILLTAIRNQNYKIQGFQLIRKVRELKWNEM
jgi:hypothetical protein